MPDRVASRPLLAGFGVRTRAPKRVSAVGLDLSKRCHPLVLSPSCSLEFFKPAFATRGLDLLALASIASPSFRNLSIGSGPSPQFQGDGKRIDFECVPPDPFIADPMQFAVVQATEWNSKFVTDLAPHCPRLGKPKVMGVDRRPATYQARLLRDKFAMFRVPEANGFGQYPDQFRASRSCNIRMTLGQPPRPTWFSILIDPIALATSWAGATGQSLVCRSLAEAGPSGRLSSDASNAAW